jgi:hypothetical protein
MTRRKSILGAMLLCSLSLCAFAAAHASATSLYVCEENPGTGTYTSSNCETSSESGAFHTVKAASPVTRETTPTSTLTLASTVMGISISIECKSLSGTGVGYNEVVEGANQALGKEIAWKIGECTALKPAGKGCKVKAGAFETNTMNSTTYMISESVTGQKYTPATGTTLASIVTEGCSLSGTYKLEGAIVGVVNNAKRAELSSTVESSKEGGLKLNGQAATIETKWHSKRQGTENIVVIAEP